MIFSVYYEHEQIKDIFDEEYDKHKDSAYYNLVKPLLEDINEESVVKILAYTICIDRYTNDCIDTLNETEALDIYLFEQYENENGEYINLLDRDKPNDIDTYKEILSYL